MLVQVLCVSVCVCVSSSGSLKRFQISLFYCHLVISHHKHFTDDYNELKWKLWQQEVMACSILSERLCANKTSH